MLETFRLTSQIKGGTEMTALQPFSVLRKQANCASRVDVRSDVTILIVFLVVKWLPSKTSHSEQIISSRFHQKQDEGFDFK